MVWIGTNQGLLRYNGQDVFESAVTNLQVTALLCSGDSILIGTADGELIIFIPVDDRITSRQILSAYPIIHLAKYPFGIAAGTDGGGLIILSDAQKQELKADGGISDDVVYDTKWYRDRLMVATDRGVDAISITQNIARIEKNYAATAINIGLALYGPDLFAATMRNGVVQLNNNENNAESWLETDADIRKISNTRNQLFILRSDGLWKLSPDHSKQTRPMLGDQDIIDFVELNEGILLALHSDGDISTVDLRFEKLRTPEIKGEITAISGNDTCLYITENAAIHIFRRTEGKLLKTYSLTSDAISVAIVETRDRIYIGTFNKGVVELDKANGKLRYIGVKDGLPDENVLSMAHRNDTLWVSTLGGLSGITADGNIKAYDVLNLVGPTYIYSLLAIHDGLLIGTDGRGILKFSDNDFVPLFPNTALSKESIYKLSADVSGQIWFNTKNNGVHRWNMTNDDLRRFPPLPKDDGYTILQGSAGSWAIEIGEGKMRVLMDSTFLDFDQGLGFKITKGDYLNTAHRASDGSTYFSSGTQLYAYRHVPGARMHPKPVITSQLVNLGRIDTERSHLEPNENHISFSFDAIWYQYPKDVTFRYKLEGLDTSWTITQSASVVYPNLPSGHYTFHLEAGHGLHFSSTEAAIWDFYIAKPFYLTWWFLVVAIFTLTMIVITIVRIRESRLNRLRLAEQERLESELANLRNQVNPHFLFNSFNTLMNIIETKPGQASDYLQRLSDFYRKILEADQAPVVKLSEELENLNAYMYLQKKRFGDAIKLHIDISSTYYEYPIPSLTLQLLAENAIKHNVITRSKPLELSIRSDGDALLVSNQIVTKNAKEPGMGIGLSNIAKRYKGLFGKEVIISHTNGIFTVKLPIITKHHARTHSGR
jgi:hypothetical protein